MKQKIKDFFLAIWYYLTFPYYWLSTRKVEKRLYQAAEEWKASATEKDVEYLRSIGIETDLETLRNGCKKN